MKQILLALTSVLLCTVIAQGDKYTDENRPYKFAFNIEGYQHRSEEKDEKGLIKGEYGFVTGDGVYHVTVYATDENGNFKILSMKNYFIGLPTDGPTQPPQQTTPRTIITTPRKVTTTPTPATLRAIKQTLRTTQGGIMGCGGCKIPTTSPRPDSNSDLQFDIDVRTKEDTNIQENEPPISNNLGVKLPSRDRTTTKIGRISTSQPSKYSTLPPKLISTTTNRIPVNGAKTLRPSIASVKPGSPSVTEKNRISVNKAENPPTKNMRNSLPNISLKDKQQSKLKDSGSKAGISEKSSSNLLYEFNQTQTFQGQFEQGFVDNSKKGDYFVNDRDGVKRVVEYEANENGFQPHIRFEKITGSDVPIPETEKDVNELKGVYFKWFYGS